MGVLLGFIKEIFTYLCFQEVLKKWWWGKNKRSKNINDRNQYLTSGARFQQIWIRDCSNGNTASLTQEKIAITH